MAFRRLLATGALALLVGACIGTTGSDLLTFRAYAAGPRDASGPLTFTNGRGWTVTLTRAKVHVGAVYLNRSVPVSGGQERECFLPGVYVAQVLRGMDVDVLSSRPTPFPEEGSGTEDVAVTGEVWLTGGRVDALEDRTVIVDVAGTASQGGIAFPFEAALTIGKNRVNASTDPARPGANPLCAERIVTPIPTSVLPRAGGALVLRIDPRGWFANVDFADVPRASPSADLRVFPDESIGQGATNLYRGVRATTSVYSFEWVTSADPQL